MFWYHYYSFCNLILVAGPREGVVTGARFKLLCLCYCLHRCRRWGAGGALAPPVGVRCPNFGQNFGQFYIFWAILRQNLGQFHIFWAILRQNFGQFHVVWASLVRKIFRTLDRKTVSFFFFFGGHLNLDRKKD